MHTSEKANDQARRGRGGRLSAAAMIAVAAMFVVGCGDDDDTDTTSATTEAATPATDDTAGDGGDAAEQEEVTIDIVSITEAFDPATVTVAAGTDVTWTNTDDIIHTTTAEDGTWDSGDMDPGDEFTFTAEEPGTYPYICTIHPSMTGELVVE